MVSRSRSRVGWVFTCAAGVVAAAVGGWLAFRGQSVPPPAPAPGFRECAAEAGLTWRMNFLPNEQGQTFKFNLYDHGSGLAVGDFDGDGREDIYFCNQLGPNALYRNKGGGDTPTATPDKPTQAAGPNEDRQEGQKEGPGGKGRGGARRGDKTEAVKKALARGLTSPTEIAEHVRRKHGLAITPGHVTTIKGALKRKGGLTQPSAARESRQEEPAGTRGEQPAAAPTPTPSPGGLTPQDLASLAQIAERAGGIDRLQEYLAVLKSIR